MSYSLTWIRITIKVNVPRQRSTLKLLIINFIFNISNCCRYTSNIFITCNWCRIIIRAYCSRKRNCIIHFWCFINSSVCTYISTYCCKSCRILNFDNRQCIIYIKNKCCWFCCISIISNYNVKVINTIF